MYIKQKLLYHVYNDIKFVPSHIELYQDNITILDFFYGRYIVFLGQLEPNTD